MLNHAKSIGDKAAVEQLERFDPYAEGFPLIQQEGHQLDYLLVRTELLNKYGIGHIHQTEIFQGMSRNVMTAKALFLFKGYTLTEKINWFLGCDFSMVALFPAMKEADLFMSPGKFDVPFYIIQGDYDYMTSQVLAKEYFGGVEAPKKEFFTFADSAHSPNMEEPERFIEVLRQIAAENPPKG